MTVCGGGSRDGFLGAGSWRGGGVRGIAGEIWGGGKDSCQRGAWELQADARHCRTFIPAVVYLAFFK